MSDMTAYCGLNCGTCGAYLATQHDDDVKRKETADQWTKMFNADIKPEDINCTGCTSGKEPLFNHCHVCEMRRCALGKGVDTCAHCGEYPCEMLDGFFKSVPEAKKNLDAIKSSE